MKTFLVSLLGLFTFLITTAQNLDNRKFIEVTGSAEMTIQPDEIELEIVLAEYDKNGKKMKLDNLESDFYKILEKNNIDPNKVKLDNSNNNWYWWSWWNYYRYYDRYLSKTLHLKLDKKTNFLKLVEDLNDKSTQSIRISSSTNKEVQNLRKEIKMEAMRAAKAKASYLLESVGEEIGGLLSVYEVPETAPNTYWFNNNISNSTSNSVMHSSSASKENGIDNVTEIKLRYEVKAKFEIK